MHGFPKTLNSKADYEYILNNFSAEKCLPHFQDLLNSVNDWFFDSYLDSEDAGVTDDTHKVVVSEDTETGTKVYSQYVLQENPTAKIFRIGYTVSEVEAIVESLSNE